ncbi:YceI family protein [Bernardetia sp.]|uniref:YceI family protein n=1 Tax=Bernardetia sp. TaxID=1937974 RepID=UPI0025C700E1|nr:YceI family protein [Bernardetia sp.]
MSTWTIDPMHSEIQFKAKHMVITTVTGSFLEFSGKLEKENDEKDNFEDATISFEAKVDSIDTGVEQRDEHLRSKDFFEAEKYPTIKFKSTTFKKNGSDSSYNLEGDMTIKGITKPIQLKVEYGGTGKDLYGQTKAGFELRGEVKRQDFGLVWDVKTEEGAVVVSDDIKLVAELQLGKQE